MPLQLSKAVYDKFTLHAREIGNSAKIRNR